MKLNGISKNKIVQQVSRIGNRPPQTGLPGSHHHHPAHHHHQLPPQPSSPGNLRQGRNAQQQQNAAQANTPATRSRRLQNEQLQNLQFRRTSSGLSAECLQLNAMQINSPPQSPMHSPRRRSSVEVEPSRLSFSSTNPLFIEADLVADNPPQEFFQIQVTDQPEEGTQRARRSSGSGICSFNFTPALPLNFSATFASSNNSSASSANSSNSASPTTSPSSSPAPGLSASARSTASHASFSTSVTSTTTVITAATLIPASPSSSSSSSQPEHGAQTTPKKILKAKRSVLPMFTDSPLPQSLSADLPQLPLPPLPTQPDEESMVTSEGKEEFAVPRPQQTKRKTSQVEPENPVPPAILSRRRGAISYTEAPQQLKDLVERLNKRPKLS